MPVHMDAHAEYRPEPATVKVMRARRSRRARGAAPDRGQLTGREPPFTGPFQVTMVKAKEPDKTADGANSGAHSDTLAACATRVTGPLIACLAAGRGRAAGTRLPGSQRGLASQSRLARRC